MFKKKSNNENNTITFSITLNDKQVDFIDNIIEKLDGQFNYLALDVINYILHDRIFYDFMDKKRTSYDDLFDNVYNGIIKFEADLMRD